MNDAIRKMLERYQIKTFADEERALREILQELTLVGLWRGKFFEHASFYGGTALRILYGLDRFSEDLDFTLLDKKIPFNWNHFEKNVVEELASYGFTVSFIEKKKQIESDVRSAFLKTNTLHALLQIGVNDAKNRTYSESLIKIKVEIDSDPIPGFEVETVFLREPMPISIRALNAQSLFAGKINAALYRAWKQRVKGRDWYDLVWFLRRGIPLNRSYLEVSMRAKNELNKEDTLTEASLKSRLVEKIEKININHAKDDVRPFLKDPSQLDVWSIDFFRFWIDRLKFQ